MLEKRVTDLLIMQQELGRCRMIYQTLYLLAVISLGMFLILGQIHNQWLLGLIVGFGTAVILTLIASSMNEKAGRVVEEISKEYGELREKLYIHNNR